MRSAVSVPTVAIGAYTKQVRNAHKTEVVSDLSNLTLRQKSFMAKSGHYASTADEEAPDATYPVMALLTAAEGPLPWNDPTDPFYTASGATDGPYFRGGPALHGFDALRFMPEGADSWCGYATISGHGSASQNGDADVPPTGGAMIEESFRCPSPRHSSHATGSSATRSATSTSTASIGGSARPT
jgi:hypothetical protein